MRSNHNETFRLPSQLSAGSHSFSLEEPRFTTPTPTPPTPTVLGQKSAWLLPGHCQHSRNQPHDDALDLQKKDMHQHLSLNHPECRTKLKTSLLSNQLCQDTKITLIFPFQVQTPIGTTLKRQHKLLCNKKCFHSYSPAINENI